MYENEIVKISDQILSTYLAYKIYFKEKTLDFGLLIQNFIDAESKFYDTINPLIVAFDHKNITNELTYILEKDWHTITQHNNYDQIIKVGKIFWFCLGNKLLSYFYNQISLLPQPLSAIFSVEYKHNDMSLSRTTGILAILSNYKHFNDDRTKSAIELMFSFVEKQPEESQRLSYLLKEHWMISRHDYDIDLYTQHLLVDFLIEKVKARTDTSLYLKFFFKIASDLLETTFREDVSSGNKITMYTINISLTDSVKDLRTKIWKFLWFIYPTTQNDFHKLLYNLGRSSHGEARDFGRLIIRPYQLI